MIDLEGTDGKVYTCEVELDRIMAYEQEHPDWSLIGLMEKVSQNTRFSDLDLLASFVTGFDGYKQWIDAGLTISDLTETFASSKYLGFSDGSGDVPPS